MVHIGHHEKGWQVTIGRQSAPLVCGGMAVARAVELCPSSSSPQGLGPIVRPISEASDENNIRSLTRQKVESLFGGAHATLLSRNRFKAYWTTLFEVQVQMHSDGRIHMGAGEADARRLRRDDAGDRAGPRGVLARLEDRKRLGI